MWTRSSRVAVALLSLAAPAAAQTPLSEAEVLARLSSKVPAYARSAQASMWRGPMCWSPVAGPIRA